MDALDVSRRHQPAPTADESAARLRHGNRKSKTGMPDRDEHGDAASCTSDGRGACGWSAQRLVPNGPSSVQRDYDGSPMKPT